MGHTSGVEDAQELEWRIYSVSDLRAPGRLRSIGVAIESDPDFRPTIAARTFPPKRRLKASFADYTAALESRFDPNEAEGWFTERDITPRGRGEVLLMDKGRLGQRLPHTMDGGVVDVGWFESAEYFERMASYLERVADCVGAFYGYCALNLMVLQRVRLLKKNAVTWLGRLSGVGRGMEDLARELPDVYWWNYFGPAYVERWGDRLKTVGVKRTTTPGGAMAIWATETPFVFDPRARRLDSYEWKRTFYEALGEDVFMREGQRQREPGEVVPSLGPQSPPVKARLLPRVVVLRDAAPLDEPDDA